MNGKHREDIHSSIFGTASDVGHPDVRLHLRGWRQPNTCGLVCTRCIAALPNIWDAAGLRAVLQA